VEPSDMTEIDLDIRSYLYLRNVWEGTIIGGGNRDFPHHACGDLGARLAGNKCSSDRG
jgi:hypothetical protein